MFNHLVESDTRKEDRRRKASFFIYTLASYAVLLMAAGVASVYAYDAHLENQNLEFLVLVAPSMQETEAVQKNETPRAKASVLDNRQLPERDQLIARINDSTKAPETVSSIGSHTPEMPTVPVAITGRNVDVVSTGSVHGPLTPGHMTGSSNKTGGNIVKIDDADKPPPLKVEQTQKKQVYNKGSLISSQAVSLPKPPYPAIAKAAGVSGAVTVQILLDETGKVISARAVSGNHLLQAAAVKAAYQARFSPTILSGQPVKVSGIITYNFTSQ